MPLTPTDVANKQFKIAFRGYSLDEVDAFLDEVETELSRLLRDNAGLKDRPAPAAAKAPAAPSAPSPGLGMEGQEAALRTLLLAQRTADEAIAEARAEAEQIVQAARTEAETAVSSARSEAAKTLNAARAEADSTVGAARTEAETTVTRARSEASTTLGAARSEATTTLGAARSEAETTLRTAQNKAASIDEDVAGRIQAATGNLDEKRRVLEARIEELRAFEREYRTRLKAYLETQLRDLDGHGPDDGGAGVPAGARAAAVGLTPGAAAGVRSRPGTPPVPVPAPANTDRASGVPSVEPPAQTGPAQTGPAQAGPAQAGPAQAGPAQAGPAQAGPAQAGPDRHEVAPAGPPREADGAALRAVPPLKATGPEPVGPFRTGPETRPPAQS